jgi:hypothetical protein
MSVIAYTSSELVHNLYDSFWKYLQFYAVEIVKLIIMMVEVTRLILDNDALGTSDSIHH